MKNSLFFLLFSISVFGQKLITPFEKGNGNQSTTYQEMLQFYKQLDEAFETIKIIEKGTDDNGEPIQLILFDASKSFDIKNTSKSKILINNGIHPGEPDGTDASMMMLRDFANGKYKAPKNVIIGLIPTYNISGMLNRGRHSRANQNGPEEYGFRGNARNFDLNRDFIKADSKNAQAFQEIFQYFQPDFFIDNHVSNGADYQYLFTYISTNKERLGNPMADFFHKKMQPELLHHLDKQKILHTPYVNIHGDVPDKGFPAFMDTPRYTTGYAALFNVPGTVAETHMLKNYDQRVKATLEYMLASINYLEKNPTVINEYKAKNKSEYLPGNTYSIGWKSTEKTSTPLLFKGYEAKYKPSDVSGQTRLYYDRNKPFEKKVDFYDSYVSTKSIVIPSYYVIPKSEYRVLEHLKRNSIQFSQLKNDSTITVESYKIADFKTVKNPYEGHYLHFDTEVKKQLVKRLFSKGDILVSTTQDGVKYLLETLEPEAVDSFFNWNFFDAILGQKEYYSEYVFEYTAAYLLKNNDSLRAEFEKNKANDKEFANDGKAQLNWVYKNSPYYETTHLQYPIYRIP